MIKLTFMATAKVQTAVSFHQTKNSQRGQILFPLRYRCLGHTHKISQFLLCQLLFSPKPDYVIRQIQFVHNCCSPKLSNCVVYGIIITGKIDAIQSTVALLRYIKSTIEKPDFATLPFAAALEKTRALAHKYYACYPFLLQLSVLY